MSEPHGSDPRTPVGWWEQLSTHDRLAFIQPALLLAGLLVYGAVRVSVDAFYRQLGATPDEVGLGYASTLTRAAVGVIGYAVVIALIASLSTWGIQLHRHGERPLYRRFGWVVLGAILVIGAAALVLTASSYLGRSPIRIRAGRVLGPAFLVVGTLFWAQRYWPRATRAHRAFAAFLAVGAVVMLGVGAMQRGSMLAEVVGRGYETRASALFTVLPVTASCVSIEWLDGPGDIPKDLDPEEGRFLYLGAAEGTVLVLKADQVSTPILFRLSEGSILLTHRVTEDPVRCLH